MRSVVSKTQVHRPCLRLIERIKEHLLAVVMISVSLREKGIVIEHVLVERPGIFRKTESGKRAVELREINRVSNRVRNWQIGMTRIDVHRRDVDFNFRRNFLEIKAADAVRVEAEAGLELDRNPFGVLADLEREFLGTNRRRRLIRCGARAESRNRRASRGRPLGDRIIWSRHIGVKTPFLRSTGTRTPPSRNLSPAMRVVHKQNVPWLPFRSGHAHAREQDALKFLRRKRHRYTNH